MLCSLACSGRQLDFGLEGSWSVNGRKQVGEAGISSLAEDCVAEGLPELLPGAWQDRFPYIPLEFEFDGLKFPTSPSLGGHGRTAIVVASIEGLSLDGMLERQQRRNKLAIPTDHRPGSGGNPAVGRGSRRLADGVGIVVVVESGSGDRRSGIEVNRSSGHRLEFGKLVVQGTIRLGEWADSAGTSQIREAHGEGDGYVPGSGIRHNSRMSAFEDPQLTPPLFFSLVDLDQIEVQSVGDLFILLGEPFPLPVEALDDARREPHTRSGRLELGVPCRLSVPGDTSHTGPQTVIRDNQQRIISHTGGIRRRGHRFPIPITSQIPSNPGWHDDRCKQSETVLSNKRIIRSPD